LPFEEGRPLATVVEESTELVDKGSKEIISRQVLMAKEDEDDGDLPIDELDAVSEDEAIANTGDEDDAGREERRTRNRARAAHRRRVNERMRSMHRELDAEFAAVNERDFRTPVANIARVTAILECCNDPNVRQALRYAQRAWI
jgi:vacuolar-type H+-ATPase subunit I/STV1